MRQSKKSFLHESLQDRESIKVILKEITRGIGRGKLVLSDEDDEMVMLPDGLLQLKVSASQDDERHRLNVRLSWRVEDAQKKSQKKLQVKSK